MSGVGSKNPTTDRSTSCSRTCRFYQAGSCIKEGLCTFFHPIVRCRLFLASGSCPYDNKCFYKHDRDSSDICSNKTCHYFLKGECIYGGLCNFTHQLDSEMNLDGLSDYEAVHDMKNINPKYARSPASVSCLSSLPAFKLENLFRSHSNNYSALSASFLKRIHSDNSSLRGQLKMITKNCSQPSDMASKKELEIDIFLKLFPSNKLKETNTFTSLRTFNLLFSSKNPKWAYKVREIPLFFSFPQDYPLVPFTVNVLITPELPLYLIEHLNSALTSRVRTLFDSYSAKGSPCLILQPFLLWLDRNLARLFYRGLRQGITKLNEESVDSPTQVDNERNMDDMPSKSSISFDSLYENISESESESERSSVITSATNASTSQNECPPNDFKLSRDRDLTNKCSFQSTKDIMFQCSFRDHTLKTGTPLPSNGICQHTGATYCWFRFACCSQLYPCLVCHLEDIENTHKIILGQQIVCGFCSVEQNIPPDDSCISCLKHFISDNSI